MMLSNAKYDARTGGDGAESTSVDETLPGITSAGAHLGLASRISELETSLLLIHNYFFDHSQVMSWITDTTADY